MMEPISLVTITSPRLVENVGVVGGFHALVPIETNHTTRVTHKIIACGNGFSGMGLRRLSRMRKPGWMQSAPAGRIPARRPGSKGSTALTDYHEDCEKKRPRARESSM